jgi:hypothetical protein
MRLEKEFDFYSLARRNQTIVVKEMLQEEVTHNSYNSYNVRILTVIQICIFSAVHENLYSRTDQSI